MGTTENESAWSTTAATNSTADAGINWAEGQDPATVNNSARGMMAGRAKARLDQGGGLSAGGTANALTSGTNQILSSGHLTGGLRLLVKATADNTSTTVTFAPDGLTAANIKRADGSALAVGSIKSGMYLDLVYNAGSSEWRCANIPPATAGSFGSALASFSAHKNASDQTSVADSTDTQVTFGTEIYDVGSFFASSTWTPPAGTCHISAAVKVSGIITSASSILSLLIYKNGASFKRTGATATPISAATTGYAVISMQDQCNGSDTYKVYVNAVSASTSTVKGTSADTWFMGTMI